MNGKKKKKSFGQNAFLMDTIDSTRFRRTSVENVNNVSNNGGIFCSFPYSQTGIYTYNIFIDRRCRFGWMIIVTFLPPNVIVCG